MQIRKSLVGWFVDLGTSAAIDEWRFITHRRGKADEDSGDNTGDRATEVEAQNEDETEDIPFRSRYLPEQWWMRSSIPGPEAEILAREQANQEAKQKATREFIVRELLTRHAVMSENDFDSAHVIRLRHWRIWTLAQIGAHFFGMPTNARERNTAEVNIRRKLLRDYQALRVLLGEIFGIDSIRQI